MAPVAAITVMTTFTVTTATVAFPEGNVAIMAHQVIAVTTKP